MQLQVLNLETYVFEQILATDLIQDKPKIYKVIISLCVFNRMIKFNMHILTLLYYVSTCHNYKQIIIHYII